MSKTSRPHKEAGKGDRPRISNHAAYWESPYWDNKERIARQARRDVRRQEILNNITEILQLLKGTALPIEKLQTTVNAKQNKLNRLYAKVNLLFESELEDEKWLNQIKEL